MPKKSGGFPYACHAGCPPVPRRAGELLRPGEYVRHLQHPAYRRHGAPVPAEWPGLPAAGGRCALVSRSWRDISRKRPRHNSPYGEKRACGTAAGSFSRNFTPHRRNSPASAQCCAGSSCSRTLQRVEFPLAPQAAAELQADGLAVQVAVEVQQEGLHRYRAAVGHRWAACPHW